MRNISRLKRFCKKCSIIFQLKLKFYINQPIKINLEKNVNRDLYNYIIKSKNH